MTRSFVLSILTLLSFACHGQNNKGTSHASWNKTSHFVGLTGNLQMLIAEEIVSIGTVGLQYIGQSFTAPYARFSGKVMIGRSFDPYETLYQGSIGAILGRTGRYIGFHFQNEVGLFKFETDIFLQTNHSIGLNTGSIWPKTRIAFSVPLLFTHIIHFRRYGIYQPVPSVGLIDLSIGRSIF